ncbi:hypothetical protein AQUCO_00900024v1, partial [Aquilegia coerulea]
MACADNIEQKMENDDINTRLLGGKQQEEEEEEEKEIKIHRKVLDELKKLWIVAGPAIFTRFSTFGVTIISQAFIGHIGATELAAFALVQTVLLRFITGILLGMSSALETLCGQAYGAKQQHMLGIYLQRSWIVLTICSFILIPLFLLATPILKLLGQDDDIANVAGYIALWLIPVMFAYVLSFTCQMYLQAQSRNMVMIYLAAAALIVHVILSWLLTVKYKLGLPGAMISTVIANWIPNVAFRDLWPVIKLSLSSGVMICLELWYNSILVLLTGNLANAEVAIDALSICFLADADHIEKTDHVNFKLNPDHLIPVGGFVSLSVLHNLAETSVRVSNELGRGSSKAAKFSIVVTVLQSLSIGIVLFVFFILFRGRLAYIFTNSEEVANAVGDLSPLLSFSILLNSVQPVLSGVAVGAGWQSIVAYVNVACYYLIGIPLGVVLGYLVHFQVT